ncbi:MAG TPA: M35 family metallo-endopeptidase [Paucimonas sp.]|nr:M35 family metallo-endopeptidase [Paucimonas sp.]
MLKADDDVVVHVTVTNTSSTPQYVLKHHAPLGGEEMEEALFEVYRDGARVDYLGAHYKRPAPKANDYYVLQPGKSHKFKLELSAFYDMSVTGNYSISYNTKSYNLFSSSFDGNGVAKAESQQGVLKSEAVSIWIDGRLPQGTVTTAKATDPLPTAGGLSFSRCTSSQQNTIVNAMSAATNMATDSDAYLQANKTGSRYTTWFGTYTSSRYSTVKSHFVAIKDAFLNKPVTVDCGCNKTYYAYVYPTQPYKIYVCKAFWSAPMTGTDSKGGTLVHEMSHFNVVAGTDDHVYGQSGAKSLAISDPNRAVENADSHEYFAENTPALN